MKQVFRSRVDWWLAAIMIVAAISPLATAIVTGEHIILMVVIALLILSMFYTVYIVEDGKLRVLVGFIPFGCKDIQQIKSVHRTTTLISSPALSIDRLLITFENGNVLVISPKDRDRFISVLLSINEQIVTDQNVDELGETVESELPKGSVIKRWTNAVWVLCGLVTVALCVYSYSIYDTMPARIATHFDLNGVPNGWMSRQAGIWGSVAIGIGVTILIWALSHLPASMISGMANATDAERKKAKEGLSLGMAISALFCLLIICFVQYYIVSKN